jgi:hypothetical protein
MTGFLDKASLKVELEVADYLLLEIALVAFRILNFWLLSRGGSAVLQHQTVRGFALLKPLRLHFSRE